MTMALSLVKSEIFEGNQADFYTDNDAYFMTVDQLVKCLGFASKSGISNVINRNAYLKTSEFSVVHKLCTTDRKSYNTRLFNEDGIYEIAFLSKTAVAQLFRAWVRKILKELRQQAKQSKQQLTPNNPLLEQSIYHIQESTKFHNECLMEHEYRLDNHNQRIEILEQPTFDSEDYKNLKDFIFVNYIESGQLRNRIDTLEQLNLADKLQTAQKEIKALKSQANRTERKLKNHIDNKPVITYFADVQALYDDMSQNYQSFTIFDNAHGEKNTNYKATFRIVELNGDRLTFRVSKYNSDRMFVSHIVKAERIDSWNGNKYVSKYRLFVQDGIDPVEFEAVLKY